MSLLLTKEELCDLTGAKQPKLMAEWLAARDWFFEMPRGRGGYPRVDRAYYLGRMSGQSPGRTAVRERPRLEFMTKVQQ